MKNKLLTFAGALALLAVLGHFYAKPLLAQVRAALVRDADNPALAPFSGATSFSFTTPNTEALVTTVPAGKRLVVEHVSYLSGGPSSGQLVYASLRNGQVGPVMLILPINPPHASASAGLGLQDASLPAKAYFDAGQDVWVSATNTGGIDSNFEIHVTGYFITP